MGKKGLFLNLLNVIGKLHGIYFTVHRQKVSAIESNQLMEIKMFQFKSRIHSKSRKKSLCTLYYYIYYCNMIHIILKIHFN